MIKRLLLALAMLFLLSGCFELQNNDEPSPSPSPNPTPTESAPENTEPVFGGVLRVPMRQPITFNPLLNEDETVAEVLKLIFEPLMSLGEDLKPQPNLAGFAFASDGMSVTVTLRDNLLWSDGTPITSEDIAFSIEVLKAAPDGAIYKGNVSNISPQMTIIDEKKLKLHLLQPFSGSRYQFRFPIIPKSHYEGETDPSSTANMNPIGNGLYVFTSYDNLKELRLTYNQSTYRQKPYITNVTALIVPDQETEMHSYDQRLLDVVSAEIADWGRYRNNQTTSINEYTTTYFDFIGFNFENTALADKRIRQAVASLVDIDDAIDSIYLSHADKAATPVNPNSWLYESNVASYPLDLDKAQTLISQARFTGELRILVNQENVERVKVAQMLAQNMEKISMKPLLQELPFEEYMAKLEAKDFDIFVGGFNLSAIPDLTFAFSSSAETDNMFSYRDDAMNGLLVSAFSAITETAYLKAMSDLQKRIAEELPCVSIAFRRAAMLTDAKVLGPRKPTLDNIYSNINLWYIGS